MLPLRWERNSHQGLLSLDQGLREPIQQRRKYWQQSQESYRPRGRIV